MENLFDSPVECGCYNPNVIKPYFCRNCGQNNEKVYNFPGGFQYVNKKGFVENVYIKCVVYNNPVTVVQWSDKTKTVCKVHGDDKYSREAGLSLCILKKIAGRQSVVDTIDMWTSKEDNQQISLFDGVECVTASDVRKKKKARDKVSG